MANRSNYKRLLALAAFIFIAIILFYFSAPYFSLQSLKDHYLTLQEFKNQHLLLSILVMILVEIIAVSFATPGVAILTILAGFLFGIPLGLIIILISATIGATITFLFVKWFSSNWFENKAKGWMSKFQKGFKNNSWGYLFALRLLPIFPFALINIIPGLLKIKTHIFVITTFFGIIPGAFVYISLGNGLKYIIKNNQKINLDIIFEPHILLPILGLTFLALLPNFYKLFKGKKNA